MTTQSPGSALLRTKLYIPPLRPEQVPRPRLIERLSAGLDRKLTLISAPAGFGKTTLVSEWIASRRRGGPRLERGGIDVSSAPLQVAWLSLDEGDNDPTRFLTYLVTALQTIETRMGNGLLGVLQSPQPPTAEVVLTALINETAVLPERVVLVLDDYHLIEAQVVHAALAFFLRHLSPPAAGPLGGGLHLVLATREDPPLPLARLRARGQLTELRAADLRFAPSEAAAFLNQAMGLDLATEEIAALEQRTEGWIAGLQLAALALQGGLARQDSQHERKDTARLVQSFTGSQRFVLDYLIEEVLEQQPESLQAFLLHTSILDRLTGSLCNALTGQSSGQAMLETLERANLFIVPLDEERRWYRYHCLFADLLRRRLRQTQPEPLPGLHGKASEWYEQHGFVDDAIDHALRSGDVERAAHLIEDHLEANYDRVAQATLQRWLSELPPEYVSSRPHLCVLHAWSLFTGGQLAAADQSLRAAQEFLAPDTDQGSPSLPGVDRLSDTDRTKLAGRAAVIRSFIASYSGDMAAAIRCARQALDVLPQQEQTWHTAALITLGDAYANQGQMGAAREARSEALATAQASGDPYILLIVHLRLAEILRQQGKLQQVIDLCERQLESAEKSGISEWAIAGWLLGIWGEVLAERNELGRAVELAKKGVERAARGGDVQYQTYSNLCLARVLYSSSDLLGVQSLVQSMENSAREHKLSLSANLQLSAWQVRIWLAQGKLELASQWARERGLDPDGDLAYSREIEYIAFVRVLIAEGRLDQAASLLQRLLEAAEAGGRLSTVIEITLLQALALQAGGEPVRAVTALEQALILAEPDGFVRTFVDEGPPLARLLYQAAARSSVAPYARRLLAAFPVTEPERTDAGKTKATDSRRNEPLIEPLSDREREVLSLIAEGLTNPEIASRLFLALNTVKGHTRSIYGKLGVHSRTQAVARARALGLFSST